VRYPIVDMGVPTDLATYGALVDGIAADVRAGRTVVVSCLAGYGRTGMTVACVLVAAGLGAREAVGLVRATRTGTIETDAQLGFVFGWVAPDRD
jgi:protein-tyrosine phosphatase